jgi:predicted nucleotidyltransferase
LLRKSQRNFFQMPDIAGFLFGAYRRDALALLLLHPEASLHVREIARMTDKVPGTLLRELNALVEVGLLLRKPVGNQVHFQANTASPVYEDLRSLLKKTAGIADVLREALHPLTSKIDLAFVFGSIARGDERAGSDLDVMIVGAARFSEVVGALAPAQDALRRQINPGLYPPKEFIAKLADNDPCLSRVLADKKIFLIGDEHDIGQLIAHWKAEGSRGRQKRNRAPTRVG